MLKNNEQEKPHKPTEEELLDLFRKETDINEKDSH